MIAFLEASLLRPLGLVAAAWLVLRVLRVRHPASRHAVWTAVLFGMLLLPTISAIGPRWTLAILPSMATGVPVAPLTPVTISELSTMATPTAVVERSPGRSASAPVELATSEQSIIRAYVVGLVAVAMYRLMGWILLRRVLSRSRSLRPACLRESADVVAPVAVGVFRPSVILPVGWRMWNLRTRRAVLAHEFAHLHRRDTVVAALGRFVTTLLWFHPLSWWVSRKTSHLAELACDAAALRRIGDPAGYSRILVTFALTVSQAGRRVALPGLAIATKSRLYDRVDRVFEMSRSTMQRLVRPKLWLAIGASMTCLAATVTLVARSPRQAQTSAIKFDVVSIKPCPTLPPPSQGRGVPGWSSQISPGYVYWSCVTLAELIDQAHTGADGQLLNVVRKPPPGSSKRVRGGPSWVGNEKFTIEIKMSGDIEPAAPEGTPQRFAATREGLKPALRALLTDRFTLRLRKASEQQPMYALTVAKGGLKITQTGPSRCFERPTTLPRGQVAVPPPGFEGTKPCGFSPGSRYHEGPTKIFDIKDATLADFASLFLSERMDRYVMDKTGVDGRFSFTLEYVSDQSTPNDGLAVVGYLAALGRPAEPPTSSVKADGPSIFKALEALGLHLEATKGPAEYWLIERAERPRPNGAAAR